jgi:hypothetical protein
LLVRQRSVFVVEQEKKSMKSAIKANKQRKMESMQKGIKFFMGTNVTLHWLAAPQN